MLFFILNVIHIQAIEIEIDLRNLEENSSIFVEGGHEVKKIPESGILKIQVENLPNLIQIVSLVKRKLVPLKTIWITKNNLKINGSISKNTIVLAASEMGEILPDDIENKWNKIDINKHPASVSSMPFLVYLANNLQSQKTDNLKRIVKNFSKTELDFWAGGKIKTYLEDLESIGFDPLKNQFEHLTAINKKRV